MSELENRLAELEEGYRELKLKLNHLTHPPRVNEVLDHIRKQTVVTLDPQLKLRFTLYGGNLSRLYQALHEKENEFVIVAGIGKKAKAVVAHLNNGEATTIGSMAVLLFSQTRKGGLIPISKIMDHFSIEEADAKKVYQTIITLFRPRVRYPKRDLDLYKYPLKRLY